MKSLLTLLACGLLAAPAYAQDGCGDLLVGYKACSGARGTNNVGPELSDGSGGFAVYAENGMPSSGVTGVVSTTPDGVTGFTRSASLVEDSSYLQFTFRGRAGRVLTVTGIDLRYSRDSGGPRQLAIRSSADGFASDLFADAISTDVPEDQYVTFGVPVEGQELTFRIYLYGAGNGDYDGVFFLHPFAGNPEDVALQFEGCVVSPLPVELSAFTASATGEVAEFAWTTASERNNDYFAVELSADGASFEEVGRVDGAGTTGTAQSYGFPHVARRGGTHYFRLRQVDFDGQDSYSEVVAVDLDGAAALTVTNTVAERELLVSVAGPATYRILSRSGDVAQAGQLGGGREPIDVSALAPGMYVLTDGITAVRFVK